MTREHDSKTKRAAGRDEEAAPPPADGAGSDDAARRDRAIDDSIESIVAGLKRVHRASQMVAGVGAGAEPATTRGLVYDLVDTNARYLRNMLGIAARVNDQIADLFASSYGAGSGCLKEKSVDVKLVRVEKKKRACGTFRLHNATSCPVNVDFPARGNFIKLGTSEPAREVPLTFHVGLSQSSATAGARPGDEVGCSTVPANGVLVVTVELSLPIGGEKKERAGDRWSGDAVITTNAAHDLGLVLELGPS